MYIYGGTGVFWFVLCTRQALVVRRNFIPMGDLLVILLASRILSITSKLKLKSLKESTELFLSLSIRFLYLDTHLLPNQYEILQDQQTRLPALEK